MTITACSDLSAASWLATEYWSRFPVWGPRGFPAYARLRFVPDPEFDGQPITEIASVDGPSEIWQLGVATTVLAGHTTTKDECYYAIWDAWDSVDLESTGAALMSSVPDRRYRLFKGTTDSLPKDRYEQLSETWQLPIPALIWPADHAWFIASDIDPHFAAIGASVSAVRDLFGDGRIDVVLSSSPDDEPFYYN